MKGGNLLIGTVMKVLGSKNNFLALSKEYSDYKDSDIVIIPLQFRKNNSIPKEILSGSKKILEASYRLKFFDEEQRRELCFEKGICSLSPLSFEKLSLQKAFDKIYKETKLHLNSGKFIAAIGGESLMSIPIIKACSEKFQNLTILNLSAHSNLCEDKGNKNTFSSVSAKISEFNSNIIQVGIRSQSAEENEFRKMKGIKTFYTREIRMGMYGNNWQELAAKNVSENVYINFDLSVFDTSVISTVLNPEPGGLLWDEVLNLIKIIGADKNIVGFDIVNFIPTKLSETPNYIVAKLIYKILNYAFISR